MAINIYIFSRLLLNGIFKTFFNKYMLQIYKNKISQYIQLNLSKEFPIFILQRNQNTRRTKFYGRIQSGMICIINRKLISKLYDVYKTNSLINNLSALYRLVHTKRCPPLTTTATYCGTATPLPFTSLKNMPKMTDSIPRTCNFDQPLINVYFSTPALYFRQLKNVSCR